MVPLSDVISGLKRNQLDFKFALEREVRVGVEAAAKLAQGFIGEEQPGWDPLTPATLADKERKGFPTPHPLERTGGLRDSIASEAESHFNTVIGTVGSTSPLAILHEHGTSRMPPRPFLGPGLLLALPAITEALAALAVRTLTPGKRP